MTNDRKGGTYFNSAKEDHLVHLIIRTLIYKSLLTINIRILMSTKHQYFVIYMHRHVKSCPMDKQILRPIECNIPDI